MLYEKRLLVLGGSGSGCVRLERSSGGINAVLTVNNVSGGDYLVIVRDDSGLLTFVPSTLTRPYSFTLPASCELSRITVIVASGERLLLWGTLSQERLWQGNLEDEIKRARKLLGQRPPAEQKRPVSDFFLDIMTPEAYDDNRLAETNYYRSNLAAPTINEIAATFADMPKPEPPPQTFGSPYANHTYDDRDRNPGDRNDRGSQPYDREHERNNYSREPERYESREYDRSREPERNDRNREPERYESREREENDRRGEFERFNQSRESEKYNESREPERYNQPPPKSELPHTLRGMPFKNSGPDIQPTGSAASEPLRPAPEPLRPSAPPPRYAPEPPRPAPEEAAPAAAPIPDTAPVMPPPAMQPPPVLGPAAFYDTVRPQLEKLFAKNEHYGALERILPDSKWIRVDYDNKGKFYLVGLIGEPVRYICYGVPGKYSPRPPAELAGYCQWLAIDENNPIGEGFWVMYQDAVSGKSVL